MKTLFTLFFSVLFYSTTLFASYEHTIQGQIIEFHPDLPDSYRDVIFRSDEFTLDTLTQLDDTGYFSLTFFVDTEITSSVRVDVIYIDPCTGETVALEVEVITEGVTELAFPACGDPIDCYAGFIPDYQGGDRLTISFTDESWTPDIIAVHWDFGDGNTSSAFNPEHTYAEGGEYLVRYEITTADSCTAVSESYVYPGNLDWYLQCVAFIYY
ncbi:MAG: PKD domain-containing protein, partial [Saprospiraceae bacterium]